MRNVPYVRTLIKVVKISIFLIDVLQHRLHIDVCVGSISTGTSCNRSVIIDARFTSTSVQELWIGTFRSQSVRILRQETCAHPRKSRLTFARSWRWNQRAMQWTDIDSKDLDTLSQIFLCFFFLESGKYQRRCREVPTVSACLRHRTFIDDESPSFVHKSWYYKLKLSWM